MAGEKNESTSYDMMTALAPAEHIAAETALSSMKKYGRKSSGEGLYRSAWSHLECALNMTAHKTRDERNQYFEYAEHLFGMALQKKNISQTSLYTILTVGSYMPLFRKRGHNELLDANDCHAVYHSLGRCVAYLYPQSQLYTVDSRMSELLILACSARIGDPDLLLFPASPREESSPHQPLNHDSYFYADGVKIPMQEKITSTNKCYDSPVRVMTLQPIMVEALERGGFDTLSDGPFHAQLATTLSLIVSEVTQDNLSSQETRVLNCLSEAVSSHFYESYAE